MINKIIFQQFPFFKMDWEEEIYAAIGSDEPNDRKRARSEDNNL